jgi:anti-sigma regulatory factor (Ser/Thr protein kinase)
MQPTAYFEVNFEPNVQLVSVVRRFVAEFCKRFLSDPDGVSRVALATHELLENAVKYSKDGKTTIRIEVEQTTPKLVRIVLRNRAELAHIEAIHVVLDRVSKAEDSFTFYQQLIASNAKNKDGGGLGLARICAEGEMKLTYKVIDADTTEIEATTSVGEGN